ncbi:hypothetical protein [Agathobacter rectalis]|nr:hypothetical protein [Agathobacter rectalis]
MKQNVCIDCRYYEACGKPERFMCLGYERAEVNEITTERECLDGN